MQNIFERKKKKKEIVLLPKNILRGPFFLFNQRKHQPSVDVDGEK